MDVISLEPGKIEILEDLVIKKSSVIEFEYLTFAKNYLKKIPKINILGKEYTIKTPEPLYYKDSKIYMERCFGKNLEIILRNDETHILGVEFLNSLLSFFINNNFGWKDFAPRNIIINENNIYIMDFERGIINPITNVNKYLIDTVYEEYSAFLLPNERTYNIDDVFNNSNTSLVSFSEIKSNRIKTILNTLGYNNQVPYNIYVLAIKMILFNEIPFKKNNNIVYPLVELEDYLKKYGYKEYAKKIIGGYYEKN